MGRSPRGRVPARKDDERSAAPISQDQPDKTDARKEPLWRRPLAWLGGLATVVIGGVLVSVLSVQAQKITSPPAPAPTQPKHSHSAAAQPSAKSPPLRVVSEEPINPPELGVWTFPGKEILPSGELAKMNSSFLHAGDPGKIAAYLQPLGGYAQYVDTQIVVKNVRGHSIRILNMNVVKNCHAPLTGTLYYAPGQAAVEDIQMGFNLDIADTSAKFVNRIPAVNPSDPDYFSKYTVVIKPGAQQVFNIRTVTYKYACTFRYDATILDGTRKVYQQIGDGKNPFRISALAIRPQPPYFSKYAVLYVGGVKGSGGIGPFVRVNPKTYNSLAG